MTNFLLFSICTKLPQILFYCIFYYKKIYCTTSDEKGRRTKGHLYRRLKNRSEQFELGFEKKERVRESWNIAELIQQKKALLEYVQVATKIN